MRLHTVTTVIIFLLISLNAWSVIEIKMTYGGLLSDPNENKIYNGLSDFPRATPSHGIGTDVLFNFPGGLNFGLRYENLDAKYDKADIKVESQQSRTAALFSWRLLDEALFFGPVLSYGFSHSGGSVLVIDNGATISDLGADKQSSYSAGLELGVRLFGFRIGLEAGYMMSEWKDLSGSAGTINSVGKLDMSGPYGKFLLGFGI